MPACLNEEGPIVAVKTVALGSAHVEVLTEGSTFRGLGTAWIGETQVRSGRLPVVIYAQSFCGHELHRLELVDVKTEDDGVRIALAGHFRPLETKVMRDHSFDPIHETGDWDAPCESGTARIELVLREAQDTFGGVACRGFSYHYEIDSPEIPLYWLLDKASWELGGAIDGATVYNQSACSDPVVTFDAETTWTTEGAFFHGNAAGQKQNPVMTHNLPRWASHQAFDFQARDEQVLLGVYDRVELIRSVLKREAGKAELKCFDKHIFNQTAQYSTSAKAILLAEGVASETARQNLWTWVLDETDRRARKAFGIHEEETVPVLQQNFWRDFTVDSYYRDLLPAAQALGVKRLFVDNLKKSAMTDATPFPGRWNWNMCCGHEYEVAPELGGIEAVRRFVEECAADGIEVMCWTNNDQALSSPINRNERSGEDSWYVLLEDARQKYGGAYMGCMSVLDYAQEEARAYFTRTHLEVFQQTGMHFFFDSFYNLAFMPVNHVDCAPRTMWRELLQCWKELQDAGIHFLIESYGPWGQPQHGHPSSYNLETAFICYKVGMGNDYTTVPGARAVKDVDPRGADGLYYQLAHKAFVRIPLFLDGERVDTVWGEAHRQALADYHQCLPKMRQRFLQEDGAGVLWHDDVGTEGTLWNFVDRAVALPGTVCDLTAGEELPSVDAYPLRAQHTYRIRGCALPTAV